MHKQLKRYRKNGLDKSTRQLISAISRLDIKGDTLLDIGAGLGGIEHTLLENGVVGATYVDASPAYVNAARKEAKRRNQEERITFLQGDFIDLANEVGQADIVTLDRVLCCYDNMQDLVRLSAAKARKLYGLVFPRDIWIIRMLVPVVNLFIKLSGSPFRSFIHRTEQVEEILRNEGLTQEYHKNAGFWQIMVFNRR